MDVVASSAFNTSGTPWRCGEVRQLVYRTLLRRRRQWLGQRGRQRPRVRLDVLSRRERLGAGRNDVRAVCVRPLACVHLHADRTRLRNGRHQTTGGVEGLHRHQQACQTASSSYQGNHHATRMLEGVLSAVNRLAAQFG